ncbi:RNA polymerase sigma factor [Algihabitans albus]|uniref:RNA polymerase sigma factor n=1 Tax=Algihabitans albus TaxID=2164067 RepID=UPI0013C35084|nr:RNA polymerase sigma factor [Algihabitans albus]
MNEQRVEQLYLEHHVALQQFLRRLLRCEEAAAEVMQDAYLRLLRFAPSRDMADSRAYLFQVAANAAYDRLSREGRYGGTAMNSAPEETIRCPHPNAEAAAMSRERLRILAEAVDDLPARCREVFLMSRLEGLSNGAIAVRLGISRNMVEKHIIKAMLRCRQRLKAADE